MVSVLKHPRELVRPLVLAITKDTDLAKHIRGLWGVLMELIP